MGFNPNPSFGVGTTDWKGLEFIKSKPKNANIIIFCIIRVR